MNSPANFNQINDQNGDENLSNPEFDVIIIGAGQGGALARMLCEAGQRVALIEREFVGGSCVNRGCTPTKAHLAAAKRAHDARTALTLGVETSDVRVDLRAVAVRSRNIVEDFRGGIRGKLAKLESLELIFGEASFVDAQTIEVRAENSDLRRLRSQKIVIATGTRAQIPKIPGLDEIGWLDHRSMLQLEEIPEKLLILGGGYIACEFAQMFARFGSQVCIAQSASQLLTREDRDIADEIAALLRAENIEIRFDCQAKSIAKTAHGLIAHLESGEKIEASHLLLATGQTPNTDALNLAATGARCDEKGFIQSDDFLGVTPGIWALGDVKGGPAFTHIAYDDARILAGVLLEKPARSIAERPVPYCVFTDPQLGRIGMTEREARGRGLEIRVAKLACSDTARGIESGEMGGFLKAIVDAKSGQVLGGAFLCRDGGEIIAVLQMAMQANLPYTALRDGIFAHPTFAESLNNLFLAMERAEKAQQCPGRLR